MIDPRETGKRRRHKLLSPVAFGIHHLVHNDLREFFERQLGHSTFFFYEFFLDQPHTRWDAPQSALQRTNCVTAPFLSRVVYQNRFIPALNAESLRSISTANDIESVPLTRSSLHDYWGDLDTMSVPLGDTDVLQALFKEWMGFTHHERTGYFTPDLEVRTQADGVVSAVSGLSTDYLRDEYPRSIIERARTDSSFQETALALLREYELVLRPWLRSRDIRQVGLVSASISSKCLFWGECLVLCSLPPDVDFKRPPAWMERLTERLCKWIGSTYIPMLTMLENYIYESDLQSILNSANGFVNSGYRGLENCWIEQNSAALRSIGSGLKEPSEVSVSDRAGGMSEHVFLALLQQCSREPNRWKGGLSKLERSFVELWADRMAVVLSSPDVVKESLVFAKYLVASPTMVRCVL